MNDRKKIMLVCDPPFFNSVDVNVCDFPEGIDDTIEDIAANPNRRRCKVTVEFAKSDIDILRAQGLDEEQIIRHYQEWLYNVVRLHIASDWECVSGYEELMELIMDRVRNR